MLPEDKFSSFLQQVPRSVLSLLHLGQKVLFGIYWGLVLFEYMVTQMAEEQHTHCQHNLSCSDAQHQEQREEYMNLQVVGAQSCTKPVINLPWLKSFIQKRNKTTKGKCVIMLRFNRISDAG